MATRYTFVSAPGIPATEREHLEKHWLEARSDKNYSVVTNYPVYVVEVEVNPYENLVVNLGSDDEGISVDEIKSFRAKLDEMKASADPRPFAVVNYNISAYAVRA